MRSGRLLLRAECFVPAERDQKNAAAEQSHRFSAASNHKLAEERRSRARLEVGLGGRRPSVRKGVDDMLVRGTCQCGSAKREKGAPV